MQGLDTPVTGTPALAVLVGEQQGSPFWIEKKIILRNSLHVVVTAGIAIAHSMCFLKGPSKQSLGKGRAEGGGWEGAGVRKQERGGSWRGHEILFKTYS